MSHPADSRTGQPKLLLASLISTWLLLLPLLQQSNVCEAAALGEAATSATNDTSGNDDDNASSPKSNHKGVIAGLDRLNSQIKKYIKLYGGISVDGDSTTTTKTSASDPTSSTTTTIASPVGDGAVATSTTTPAAAEEKGRSIIAGAPRCAPGEIYYLNHCRALD